MRAGSDAASGRRATRWVALAAAVLIALGASSATALAGPGAPREPDESGGPSESGPPADNVFPVPLPHEVTFADTWHACRDGCARQHKGNDIMADEGAPAVAVEPGVIAKVDDTDDGLGGLTLWLRGDSGVTYYYAHNSTNLVRKGQRVSRGQMIARVGHTGNARTTPSHIHFQINLCGDLSSAEPCTVDPHPYLLAWAQGQIDGGADGVAWLRSGAGTVERRTEAGSVLPSLDVVRPGDDSLLPVAGDWDGDGRDSVGVYRRADATFVLQDDENRRLDLVRFGRPGDDVLPVAGDFDGDGRDTVGLYRRADASFVVYVDDGEASAPVPLGAPGRTDQLPLVGDWDGDGTDSVGVYRRADGSVARLDDEGEAMPRATAGAGGDPTWPVAGDWTGDGRDAVGVLDRTAGELTLPTPNALDPDAVRIVAVDDADGVVPVGGDWNGRDLITRDELRAVYGDLADDVKVVEGLPALNAAMLQAGISTPARKAAFLATLRSESAFRYDAVEAGSDRRYRGRGFIQLTGDFNYRSAGESLEVDLEGDPDLAINGLVSPAVAAWYWTVARDINRAADAFDMAAVNIAVGFAPSVRRDMVRCGDFLEALRYFSGEEVPEQVNCERTAGSRLLALSTFLPGLPGGSSGAPSGRVTLPPTSLAPSPSTTGPSVAPTGPSSTGSPGGRSPGTGSSGTGSTTSRPPTTSPGTTRPPSTGPGSTQPTTTQPSTTAPPSTGSGSSTTTGPTPTGSSSTTTQTSTTTTTEPSTASSTTSTTTSVPDPSTTAPPSGTGGGTLTPDDTTSTTLLAP